MIGKQEAVLSRQIGQMLHSLHHIGISMQILLHLMFGSLKSWIQRVNKD